MTSVETTEQVAQETSAIAETAAVETAPQDNDPLNSPEVNQAAMEFSRLVPKIKTAVYGMSLRQLQRVLFAVAEFPLGNKYPKFVSEKETELFMMMLHAEGTKGIMKHAVLQNASALQEIQQQAVDSVVQEQIEKTKENT